MSRPSWFTIGIAGVAAVAAAAMLGTWLTERAADASAPEPGRQESRPGDGRRPASGGALGQRPTADGAQPPGQEEPAAAPDPERQAVERAARDLEYSAGLPEPPQQLVAPPPPSWTPDPGAAGASLPVIDEISPTHGPAAGGTTVTLRGRNLRARQVMFGAAPARIISASPEAVTVATPPARAGQVAIVLTNADGTYDIAEVPFTYGR